MRTKDLDFRYAKREDTALFLQFIKELKIVKEKSKANFFSVYYSENYFCLLFVKNPFPQCFFISNDTVKHFLINSNHLFTFEDHFARLVSVSPVIRYPVQSDKGSAPK